MTARELSGRQLAADVRSRTAELVARLAADGVAVRLAGVGPITTAQLLANTVSAAAMQAGRSSLAGPARTNAGLPRD